MILTVLSYRGGAHFEGVVSPDLSPDKFETQKTAAGQSNDEI